MDTGGTGPSAPAGPRWEERLAERGMSWVRAGVWPLLYAVALGSAVWVFFDLKDASILVRNQLESQHLRDGLGRMGQCGGGILALYAGLVLSRRLRGERRSIGETVRALNGRLFWILACPFVAFLSLAGIEKTSPLLSLFLILIATAALAAGFKANLLRGVEKLGETLGRSPGLASAMTAAGLLGLWAGFGFLFSVYSINTHRALLTGGFDLAIYDNLFYQSAHGRPLGCSWTMGGTHLSAHFDPIIVLLSPLYLLFPRVELILVLQAVWLGHGVLPAYLLARRALDSRGAGMVLAAAYTLYPALHGAVLYDFHSLTLTVPLVLWLLYALERRSTWGYAVALALLLLCREDQPLLAFLVGLHAVGRREPWEVRIGLATMAVSVVYFVAVRIVVMPSGPDESYSYVYKFSDLAAGETSWPGVWRIAGSLLVNPVFALKHALTEAKFAFFGVLLVPLLFLPLLAGQGKILLLWGFLFCGLASDPMHFDTNSWYAVTFFPAAIALVPAALRDLARRRWIGDRLGDEPLARRLLLFGLLAASLMASWKFGAVVENAHFRPIARWRLTEGQREAYAWIQSAVSMIPPEARVRATNQLAPHVSNRWEIHQHLSGRRSDYLLYDDRRILGELRRELEKSLAEGRVRGVSRFQHLALYEVVAGEEEDP